MSIETHFDGSLVRVVHVGRGEVSVQEIRDRIVKTFGDARFDAHMDILWDLRDATLPSLDFVEVEEVEGLLRHFWMGTYGRTAVVVSTQESAGISMQFGDMVKGLPRIFSVFTSMTEAEQWLGRGRA